MAEQAENQNGRKKVVRKRWLIFGLVGVVLGMNGFAYASVPAYRAFCQSFGFAGIPGIAAEAPASADVIEREITVRFNADINPELDWRFKPKQRSITLQVGDSGLAFFEAASRADHVTGGVATFNVTPLKAAPYFVKIQCFCFDSQALAPHEVVDMPVTFFVDPEIANDKNLNDVETITLSYTFFADPDAAASAEARFSELDANSHPQAN